MSIPVFRKGDKPDKLPYDFRFYRKKIDTLAARVEGQFEVETAEGTLRCDNGWVAFDSRGYPYPIAAHEFEAIYDEVPGIVAFSLPKRTGGIMEEEVDDVARQAGETSRDA